MQPTHILHVFYGFGVGGSEVRTCHLINALGDSYRHTIVALNGDFTARSLIANQDDVTLLHPPGFLERSYLSNVIAARRWIKKVHPDLMIAFAWGGFEWIVGNSILKICPDICAIEGFGTEEAIREKPQRRLLRRIFSSRCTSLLACSLKLKTLALTEWRAHPERVIYIPNGIDLHRFAPRSWDARSPRVVLGIVASLLSVKNHLMLLDAFRRLRAAEAELLIVGDGPERTRVEKYIADCGLSGRVKLLGHHPDPSQLLCQFDIFCLSSVSEQMPIAVLEAMATALPVVSTDVGDVKHMVCAENKRFVVPLDNVEAYAAALDELVADAQLRALVGKQNRKRSEEEFDFSLMLQRHKDLYDRCIQG